MTRIRSFGSDTDFSAWMRGNQELTSNKPVGFVATDIDIMQTETFAIHRFGCIRESGGIEWFSRNVQCLMHLEIKTRGGTVNSSQLDTISKLNLFRGDRKIRGGHWVKNLGFFLLSMDGKTPEDSNLIRWGVLPDEPISDYELVDWFEINNDELINILLFKIDPAKPKEGIARLFDMQKDNPTQKTG